MSLLVVIVIGLIILAILIFLLVRNVGNADRSMGGCVEKGGQCRRGECEAGESGSSFFTRGCPEDDICCIPEQKLLGQQG